tara:strand:- start:55 stop:366 length:312 start_codon:yes stop_codon:yes gene_type:complete
VAAASAVALDVACIWLRRLLLDERLIALRCSRRRVGRSTAVLLGRRRIPVHRTNVWLLMPVLAHTLEQLRKQLEPPGLVIAARHAAPDARLAENSQFRFRQTT